MDRPEIVELVDSYLEVLCGHIGDRSVGSEGNRRATRFFEDEISKSMWSTEIHSFDAVDWQPGLASIAVDRKEIAASPSPYSLGCAAEGPLVTISSVEELAAAEIKGSIVLLFGEIASEQLMPKNFVFYNPDEHKKIISLLESGNPAALVCATGRNPALAGGLYPFPLIEDGDFDIPSVFITEEIGLTLARSAGNTVQVNSISKRIAGKGYNVVARNRDHGPGKRIVVTAHIDAKKGTPGAIDNATGVIVLLILARLLATYRTKHIVELVALNGEDYFAVPGQMLYLRQNESRFDEILLNINIDGAGYLDGNSAYSFYELASPLKRIARDVFSEHDTIAEGVPWIQGDHSIFVFQGCSAIAISSEWFTENIDSQQITHTPKDDIEIVDSQKVAELSVALEHLLRSIDEIA